MGHTVFTRMEWKDWILERLWEMCVQCFQQLASLATLIYLFLFLSNPSRGLNSTQLLLQDIDVTKDQQQVTRGKKPTVLMWKIYFWMLSFLENKACVMLMSLFLFKIAVIKCVFAINTLIMEWMWFSSTVGGLDWIRDKWKRQSLRAAHLRQTKKKKKKS